VNLEVLLFSRTTKHVTQSLGICGASCRIQSLGQSSRVPLFYPRLKPLYFRASGTRDSNNQVYFWHKSLRRSRCHQSYLRQVVINNRRGMQRYERSSDLVVYTVVSSDSRRRKTSRVHRMTSSSFGAISNLYRSLSHQNQQWLKQVTYKHVQIHSHSCKLLFVFQQSVAPTNQKFLISYSWLAWRSSGTVCCMNEVTSCWAQSVLRWVTVCGE